MNSDERQPIVTRRGFLGRSLAALSLAVSGRHDLTGADSTSKTKLKGSKAAADANPYAYDLDQLRKVDPALVRYELSREIPVPGGDLKRVTLDPQGRLTVAAGKSVLTLSAEGSVISRLNVEDVVRSLAYAPDGTLFLGLRNRIQVFDPKGAPKASWPVEGERNWISSLAIAEEHIFAADAGNRVVLRMDRNGKVTGRIGEKDPARNILGLVAPSPYLDVRLGREGRLWVANPGRQRLEAYTFEGALESFWGEPSFAITGFCGCCNPAHFALAKDGRFITSEKGLPRVKVYSESGKLEYVVAGPNSFPRYFETAKTTPPALDVAVDDKDSVYVCDPVGKKVQVFRPKTPV